MRAGGELKTSTIGGITIKPPLLGGYFRASTRIRVSTSEMCAVGILDEGDMIGDTAPASRNENRD